MRQRVYALAAGYEDLNDHQQLRNDLAIQTTVERTDVLASSSTLCRWENRSDRQAAWDIHEVMVAQFIASVDEAPKELILDFDATDDTVHGKQEGRSFNGYYDHYCFLPLYVFCKDQLLVSYLRPSNVDGAKHAWAILSLLVKRFRQTWPQVKIVFRGDSGFCRHKMLTWCKRHNVSYIVGIAQNKRLNALATPWQKEAEKHFLKLMRKCAGLKNYNWIYLLIAPVAITGGLISFVYCFHLSPISCWKPYGILPCKAQSWREFMLEHYASN